MAMLMKRVKLKNVNKTQLSCCPCCVTDEASPVSPCSSGTAAVP